MKNFLIFVVVAMLAACSFPKTPGEGSLMNGTRQYRPELFNSGARGQVIIQLSDTASKGGIFGKKYKKYAAFKNVQTGEAHYLTTSKQGGLDAAMLPIGKYQMTNLFLQFVTTRTYRQGNVQITETIIEKHEHFEGNSKITFDVKPGEITYIGNLELIKGDNKVDDEGAKISNTFKIADKSAEIEPDDREEFEKELGGKFIVRLMTSTK
ncbi:MAG: hypothetical protein LBB23_04665 [Rickettsiales bacterium]|jgi:hypothetical protein|nr:hypothetical protein [Rickettsiales bacterium]